MNGLSLRVGKGGSKKTKNSNGFPPLEIVNFANEFLGSHDDHQYNKFLNSPGTDEQLIILKQVLDQSKVKYSEETVRFLCVVFFHSEIKHPVKCFLMRHITKATNIQLPFSKTLSSLILSVISPLPEHYEQYTEVVVKISACVENFGPGAAAVKAVEMELMEYLTSCLKCCLESLRGKRTLSPTEKNEIYNLIHLTLRMLLYIIQKASHNHQVVASWFEDIRSAIKELLPDEDVPMDTKSVCGLLYMAMRGLESGPDSWNDILNPTTTDEELSTLLSNDAAELALYSAIVISVAMDRLQCETVGDAPAIVVLTKKILAIGERTSSRSTLILGVSRAVTQMSRSLYKVSDHHSGLLLLDDILVFIWSHLEHYLDSVRHLAAQALGHVVKYCAKLNREGNERALSNLFSALTSLDRLRKSFYVGVTSLATELGAAEVMERLPGIVRELLVALSVQAVQASATVSLETLLQKHSQEYKSEVICAAWVDPILSYVSGRTLDTGVLNALEALLAKAVRMNDEIMDYILLTIKQSYNDMKCVLMLLSVVRKSGACARLDAEGGGEWRGVIGYDVLRGAAVDASEETRILSLSLVVESPKTTEPFTVGDLEFILWYLRYNINAQSPNFRQLTLSIMKKFIKRLDDSYKVLRRQRDSDCGYYVTFVEDLRSQCFGSLLPGANYSRRVVALQVLAWSETVHLEGYQRVWKEEYVEKLLLHLEDSYENNKALALHVLESCPEHLLKSKSYSTSLELEDILHQASSLKPTDCISAAYKLSLLQSKLPDNILQGEICAVSEPLSYTLLKKLLHKLHRELSICCESIVSAAVHAPMYGILHCMGHLVSRVRPEAISSDERWSTLIEDVITTCILVNAAVACVVNNSSPEGHLPMDMGGVEVNDQGNSGGVRLADGRQVTAQMVLLCAWRSVKEVSLLLGELSSRLTIVGEEGAAAGTITQRQLEVMGEHFTTLLAETKHRGAFEQAYVGFNKLLDRLWRCRSPRLHELPRAWLATLMSDLSSGESRGSLCATRRSAGLPFMIQALVTTELQVHDNPKCFHECMTTLLRVSCDARSVETRTHAVNILRALYRTAALYESVGASAGEGLVVAIRGFEGDTWMERNSSTLLFSALMVRIFGVQRSKDAENLCVRNRMTGRIFFLRYPQLYDFMLNKLEEVSKSDDVQILKPSLYPILLLLARLYPSSLEGTVSNLKLVAFVPHVLACARSGVLKTRQLAAKAMVPLISPQQYNSHLESVLSLICDPSVKRNYCHGILLQLIRLVDAKPSNLIVEEDTALRLSNMIYETKWLLQQAVGERPCYLITDEYVKFINLVIWRFPTLIKPAFAEAVAELLEKVLFREYIPKITSGREICLANALYIYLIILETYKMDGICELVYKSLTHTSYEVILSTLNYLLILHENIEVEGKFQEHLKEISDGNVLKELRENPKYISRLCDVMKNVNYLECIQKSLKVIVLEGNTQRFIVKLKYDDGNDISDDVVVNKLFELIQNEHENLKHIYLASLTNFVTELLRKTEVNCERILDVLRMLLPCSSSDNSEETRGIAVDFLERNLGKLLDLDVNDLVEKDRFEYKAITYAMTVMLLEDDDATLRQRVSDAVTGRCDAGAGRVTPSKAAESLLHLLCAEHDAREILLLVALMDFRSQVYVTDDGNDECRVFDQNERYNIHLEETVWTDACAAKIQQMHSDVDLSVLLHIALGSSYHRDTFDRLCGNNLTVFGRLGRGEEVGSEVVNPKVRLLVDRFSSK